MTIRIQIFVGILIILMLVYIGVSIKREKIDLKYSLPWIVLCLVAAVFDIFPQMLEKLARACGMRVPANMVFLVAIALLALAVYLLTAAVSRLSRKHTRLIQEFALLKREVEQMRAEIRKQEDRCAEEPGRKNANEKEPDQEG